MKNCFLRMTALLLVPCFLANLISASGFVGEIFSRRAVSFSHFEQINDQAMAAVALSMPAKARRFRTAFHEKITFRTLLPRTVTGYLATSVLFATTLREAAQSHWRIDPYDHPVALFGSFFALLAVVLAMSYWPVIQDEILMPAVRDLRAWFGKRMTNLSSRPLETPAATSESQYIPPAVEEIIQSVELTARNMAEMFGSHFEFSDHENAALALFAEGRISLDRAAQSSKIESRAAFRRQLVLARVLYENRGVHFYETGKGGILGYMESLDEGKDESARYLIYLMTSEIARDLGMAILARVKELYSPSAGQSGQGHKALAIFIGALLTVGATLLSAATGESSEPRIASTLTISLVLGFCISLLIGAYLLLRLTPRKAQRQLEAMYRSALVAREIPEYLPRLIGRFGAIPLLETALDIGPRFIGIFEALGHTVEHNPDRPIYQEDLTEELMRSFKGQPDGAVQESAFGGVLSASERVGLPAHPSKAVHYVRLDPTRLEEAAAGLPKILELRGDTPTELVREAMRKYQELRSYPFVIDNITTEPFRELSYNREPIPESATNLQLRRVLYYGITDVPSDARVLRPARVATGPSGKDNGGSIKPGLSAIGLFAISLIGVRLASAQPVSFIRFITENAARHQGLLDRIEWWLGTLVGLMVLAATAGLVVLWPYLIPIVRLLCSVGEDKFKWANIAQGPRFESAAAQRPRQKTRISVRTMLNGGFALAWFILWLLNYPYLGAISAFFGTALIAFNLWYGKNTPIEHSGSTSRSSHATPALFGLSRASA